MSSCKAVDIGFIAVPGVAVYGVDHVALAICDDGWVLRSDVVQELLQLCHCVLSWFGLLQCKCAEGGKNGAVDSLSVPEECAEDLL